MRYLEINVVADPLPFSAELKGKWLAAPCNSVSEILKLIFAKLMKKKYVHGTSLAQSMLYEHFTNQEWVCGLSKVGVFSVRWVWTHKKIIIFCK